MKTIALTVIAATAGLAAANPVLSTSLSEYTVDSAGGYSEGLAFFDVSGFGFNDSQGSPLNQTTRFGFVLNAEVDKITGFAWNVNLTTIGASWGSDAVMRFEDQFDLVVSDDPNPVSNQNYTSGRVNLSDLGLPNISIGADKIVDIEFFDSWVDNGGTGDAFFESGSSITVYYPNPGTLATLALGGLAASRRRR